VKLNHIDHVAIAVSDLDRSERWYTDVLGLERRFPEWDEPVMVCAGNSCVALFSATGANTGPPAGRDAIAMRHFAFHVNRANFEGAQAECRERGIDFEFADHGPVHSIYINDPDGYRIEITTDELR
jgi:catechol 2,3-dioxygenase